MESYPKLLYAVSCFSDFSSAEFELVVEGVKRRYGESVFDSIDEQTITELVALKEPVKQDVTSFWVKEAVREYHYRTIEKQFR